MVRVLIVDDEVIVRLAIRELFDRLPQEFAIVGEASNGKSALACYEAAGGADLILTDITMPIMDGIVLTREFMRQVPAPLVVAISSYDDYPLVREAFKAGASDYILKDSLNADSLSELLDKLLDKETEQKTMQTDQSTRQKTGKEQEKQEFLAALCRGQAPLDRLADRFRQLDIHLHTDHITICCVTLEPQIEEGQVAAVSALRQILQGKSGEVVIWSKHQFLVLLSFVHVKGQKLSETEYLTLLEAQITQLHYHFRTFLNLQIQVGVSSVGSAKQLPALLAEAVSPIHTQIRKAQEFICQNYAEDLPLKLVSDYVSLSENYFSSQFFKYSGKNFSDYVLEIRMEKAKQLLKTTDLKIYEICEKIGYKNVEHFSRMFKRSVGKSPLQYRNNHKFVKIYHKNR